MEMKATQTTMPMSLCPWGDQLTCQQLATVGRRLTEKIMIILDLDLDIGMIGMIPIGMITSNTVTFISDLLVIR